MAEADGPMLSRFADDPEMREIVALFIAEVPDRLRELHDAWTSGDLQRVRTIAHQIKGAAGGYGYPEVSDSAAALESAAAISGATVNSVSSVHQAFASLLGRVARAG